MGYDFRESPSPLVSVVWQVEVESDSTYTDAANEFWGLAFNRSRDGTPGAVLIGPSRMPRVLDLHAGEVGWGVELAAHVFLHRIPKLSLLGEMRELLTDGEFFELAGVRLPVPSYDSMETLVETLQRQGILAADDTVAAALAGEDPAYSARQLRRRSVDAVGLGRKQVEQLRRARSAYRLLQEGASLADAAQQAGFSDQAHLTRAFRSIAGLTPARILADDVDAFSSRPE